MRDIVITGPTASGKTTRAVALARRIGGEIVSADSRQVYRGMDIGTGKDLQEYGEVPCHLVDIAEAGEKYNLFQYLRDAAAAVDAIRSRGKAPVVCGGTGMYLEALIRGLRLPEVPRNEELRRSLDGKTLEELTRILSGLKTLHNTTDTDTRARAIRAIEIQTHYAAHPDQNPYGEASASPLRDPVIIATDIDRDSRRRRISERLRTRLGHGMVEEVRGLLESGVEPQSLIYYGLEYKFVTLYLTGAMAYEDMVSRLEIAIHQFAKRQMTWFHGMERRGFTLRWLPYDMPQEEFTDAVLEAACEK